MKSSAPSSRYFEAWNDSDFGGQQKIYRVVSLITQGLVSGDVLDLGCGSRVYYDVTGVMRWVGLDLSRALLDQLRFLGGTEPAGPVEKLNLPCHDLPFADGEFDTVCAMFMLHHLGRTNRRQTERAVLDTLKEACLSGYHPHPLYVVCLLGLQARAGAGALRRRSG